MSEGDSMKTILRALLAPILLGIAGSVGGLGASAADAAAVVVQTAGASYGEWSARWWQWLLSIPAAVNPNLDSTGANCGVGQFDGVWFLAGGFGGTYERSCTIPAGKPIFFPLINSVAFKPGGKDTLLDLRKLAAEFIDSVNALDCTIDNTACAANLFQQRVRSPSFTVLAPQKGLIPPGNLSVPGNSDSLVSDGYWLLFAPLTAGQHRIVTHAGTTGGFDITLIYNLTVE
jgi:hypothetical protein